MNDGDEFAVAADAQRMDALIKKNIIIIIKIAVLFHMLNSTNYVKCIFAVSNLISMCTNKEKIRFIDEVVEQLSIYCPQMSAEVTHFAACQFALESNFGKSRIAVTRNNYCGMRVPCSRLSNNLGHTGFAKYASFVDCVIDYCYWLAWNHFDSETLFSIENFSRKLIAKKYCPEKDYIDSIYSIYNSLKVKQDGKN